METSEISEVFFRVFEIRVFNFGIVIKKRKDSLKIRAILLIYSFELEISRVAVQAIHQNSKKVAAFSEEILSENDIEAVLVPSCCYDYGASASEEIEKIATDKKDHHKCSLCVIVCCIAKACYQ